MADGLKLSPKMLVFPLMFFAVKKVDFKDPQIVYYAQIGFCASIGLLLLMYFYISNKINTTAEGKPVWIPPPGNLVFEHLNHQKLLNVLIR